MEQDKYKILKIISEQNNTIIYKGIRIIDNCPVVIKTLKEKYPDQNKILKMLYEYELLKDLEVEGVIKLHELTEINNVTAVVEEYFNGKPLLKFKKHSLIDKLNIFIKIIEIMDNIHKAGIIHKDINPNNILVSQNKEDIRIIDFGLSVKLDKEEHEMKDPNLIEGTLHFLSPEQTGRMNRHVDFRTDYYSLGATLYKILTGKNLFPEARDAMEIIHFHIAKNPVAPHLANNEIPMSLSKIILKLLEKNAENRYQSSYGLLYDLKKVLEDLNNGNNNSNFDIGTKDKNILFQIPQKLYGREKEKEILFKCTEDIKSGISEAIFITGYSGIGKSSLINEIHRSISKNNGYFISGKFDQYQKDTPYSALISAFKELIKLILSENEFKVFTFKEKLREALGDNGKLLTDVVPELGIFIGKQKDVPPLSPMEAQNRFNFVLERFIRVFATKKHPLIIFLDDLQWVDPATLSVLKILLKDLKLKHFLLIGAYRDNEVSLSHPLNITIESLKKEVKITLLKLAPLNLVHINTLISETLNEKTDKIQSLSNLVFQKTRGNPFFTKEFLTTLYKYKLIKYNSSEENWTWDTKKIEEQNISGNVVDFMLKKLNSLPKETRIILNLSACLGNYFKLSILSLVTKKSVNKLAKLLWPAVKEGFIIPIEDSHKILSRLSNNNFLPLKNLKNIDITDKFLHDRVQQAAYELVPKEQIDQIHLKIGRTLWKVYKKKTNNDDIFLFLEHLNKSIHLIDSKEEKKELAILNLITAKRERESNAYNSSIIHSNIGITLLGKDLWKENYDLAYKLFLENAEGEYLSRNFENAENRFDELLKNSKTKKDRYSVYKIMMVYFISINKFDECIHVGITALKEWDINFPQQDNQDKINGQYEIELDKYNSFLKKLNISEISKSNKICQEEKEIAMEFLEKMIDAAYLGNPNILNLIILTLVNLSIEYGNSESTPSGYVWWGVVLISQNQIDDGYNFGRSAIELVQDINNSQITCRTYHMFGGFIQFWKEHISNSIANLSLAFEFGTNSGDINYSNYAEAIYGRYIFYKGKNLIDVKSKADICLDFMKKTKHNGMYEFYTSMYYVISSLLNKTKDYYLLSSSKEMENKKLDEWYEKELNLQISLYYIMKLYLHYMYGDYDKAEEYIEKAKEYILWITPQFDVIQFWFYSALVKTALYPYKSREDQKKDMDYINLAIEKISFHTNLSKINFINKLYILKAEKNRILNKCEDAMKDYENGILFSKNYGFLQEEALANELYSEFWINNQSEKLGKIFLTESLFIYKKWGAQRKVLLLEKKNELLLKEKFFIYSFDDSENSINNFSSTTKQEILDLETVIKASQVLSKEIKMKNLLEKMMELVVENSGAQRGLFITKNDSSEFISIEIDTVEEQISTEQKEVSLYNDLVKPIVYYVINSQESLIIENASTETRYLFDKYVQENQIKSVLCYPVMNKEKLVGIIYLENNMIPGVFNKNRIELLDILSAQLAISIENSAFYENLEHKVKERTVELFKKNELLKLQNLELERLSTTDQLTGIYNRRYLENQLDNELHRCERYSKNLSLLILDVDKFKTVNDTYGHNIGDEVLITIANTIKSTLRKTDILGRWGGEEFLVILPECDSPYEIAEKIRTTLEQIDHNRVGSVTASIGISTYMKTDTKTSLVSRADKNLYIAKESGRNKVIF